VAERRGRRCRGTLADIASQPSPSCMNACSSAPIL
jgi:hypothetical protein